MFGNWGMEALKWKYMMHPLQQLSYANAFKAIMSGCSITMITPNRVGEYGGRMLFVKKDFRVKSISISMIGSLSQLIITFLMGALALLYIQFSHHAIIESAIASWLKSSMMLLTGFACLIVLSFCYFKENMIWPLLQKIPLLKKLIKLYLDCQNQNFWW